MLEGIPQNSHTTPPVATVPTRGAKRVKLSDRDKARLRVIVFNRDDWTCQNCRKVIPPRADDEMTGRYAPWVGTEFLELDHITPYAAGGTYDPANIQALCTTCNRRKSASTRHSDWPARIAVAQQYLASHQPSKAIAMSAVAILLGGDS